MRVFRWVGLIFLLIGSVFAAVAVGTWWSDSSFAQRAAKAQGVVVALERKESRDSNGRNSLTYASRVRFVADNRPVEFVETVSSSPSRHAVGQRVPLLYDPAQPTRAVVDDFWGRAGLWMIFGAIGSIFVVVGGGLTGYWLFRAQQRRQLLRDGIAIQAQVIEVFRDRGLRINGRWPYRVAAQAIYPRTGRMRRFESEPLLVDPTAQVQGRGVTVRLGSGRSYAVDLSPIVDDSVLA